MAGEEKRPRNPELAYDDDDMAAADPPRQPGTDPADEEAARRAAAAAAEAEQEDKGGDGGAADEGKEKTTTGKAPDEGEEDDGLGDLTAEQIETRARRMGWVPEADYKGKAGTWRDARTFLARGLNSNRILQDRYEKLETQQEATARQLAEANARLTESGEVLREIYDRFKTADRAGYERARREIMAVREEAVAAGDTDKFKEADRQLEALDTAERDRVAKVATTETERAKKVDEAKPAGQPKIDPVAVEWAKENPWFDEDPALARFAIALHQDNLTKKEFHHKLKENLDDVARQVKAAFPERFENPRRSAPGAVNGDGRRGGQRRDRNARTYDNLPAESKAACDRLVRTIKGYTREEYVRDYDWT